MKERQNEYDNSEGERTITFPKKEINLSRELLILCSE